MYVTNSIISFSMYIFFLLYIHWVFFQYLMNISTRTSKYLLLHYIILFEYWILDGLCSPDEII